MDISSSYLSNKKLWLISLSGIVILLLITLSYFINSEALRNRMESRINSKLKDYTVHIGKAYFHPIQLGIALKDLVLIQQANPSIPVADISELKASLHWRELLTGHVVGGVSMVRPKFHINRAHFNTEKKSETPISKKGWQEAIQSIYPLKIDMFSVYDGEFTYIDEGPYKPLTMDKIEIIANNIRNIRYKGNEYPSAFRFEGRIFGKGKLLVNGHANFLQEPYPGLKARIDLSELDVSYFEPVLKRYNITVRNGVLAGSGDVEYSPEKVVINLEQLKISGADLDYVHLAQTASTEKERVKKAKTTVKELSNEPETKIRVNNLSIESSSLAYIDKTKEPVYRLFINQLNGSLKNFTNQFAEGPASLELNGRFMGTGVTSVNATFRPETENPDFKINIAIENTDMRPMSDLFRRYGKFDIKAGMFSFYSELTVKNNTINGYLKPLFKNLQVYDARSEEEKSVFRKLYTGLVKGLSKLLRNEKRQEIATKSEIAGPLEDPKANTWQVILNLLRNAFIEAILPGFENEIGRTSKT